MKHPLKFSQALKAAIDRAIVRHKLTNGRALTLRMIAENVGIDTSTLARALRGEGIPDMSTLLPLLVYLGCDEEEQRFLFHLAEFTPPADKGYLIQPITDESAATLFTFPDDTDPEIERTTEKQRVPRQPPS